MTPKERMSLEAALAQSSEKGGYRIAYGLTSDQRSFTAFQRVDTGEITSTETLIEWHDGMAHFLERAVQEPPSGNIWIPNVLPNE